MEILCTVGSIERSFAIKNMVQGKTQELQTSEWTNAGVSRILYTNKPPVGVRNLKYRMV